MRKFHAIALATVLPLAACGRNDPPPAPAPGGATAAQPATDTVVSRKLQEAMARSSEKLATANIPVGGRIHHGIRIDSSGSPLPKAEITPQGDLLIDGKAVAIDEQQRKLLLEHRANVVAIAQAGIAVGMQGAELGVQGAALGMKAATGALKSALSGNSEEFEKQMEAEGKRIEAEGRRIEAEANRMICARMPPLLASQQALAAALPAFAPYATMDESDVKECGKDGAAEFDSGDDAATARPAQGAEDHAMDAAAEAEMAAGTPASAGPWTRTSARGVKYVFPSGPLEVKVENGTTTMIGSGMTLVTDDATFLRVNGVPAALPDAGKTVRVDASGKLTIF
ncbi:MAG TPA: hypothetical protein PLO34_01690 [Pseudoxanthomonas sp.]|nr:hypothetical protein [Pseudoxanthomonas sp.]